MDSNLITMIELLRSQISEIHHSIQQELLAQIVRRTNSKFKLNETRKSMVRINVTCIDQGEQVLVVEELSRILSLADSLKTSFDVLTQTQRPTGIEEESV
jgi:hypothetical protein